MAGEVTCRPFSDYRLQPTGHSLSAHRLRCPQRRQPQVERKPDAPGQGEMMGWASLQLSGFILSPKCAPIRAPISVPEHPKKIDPTAAPATLPTVAF